MPHSKQAQKRVRTSEETRDHNRAMRSAMKTAMKRVEEAVSAKNAAAAREALSAATQKIDKCAKNNVVHKNTAARKKSHLARRVSSLG